MVKPLLALYDNLEAADDSEELTFKEGDVLLPVREYGSDDAWIEARHLLSSATGLVPINYVSELPQETLEVLFAEFGNNADDDAELTFGEGDKLFLIKDLGEEWLYCKDSSDSYGLVPANYVKRKQTSTDSPGERTEHSNGDGRDEVASDKREHLAKGGSTSGDSIAHKMPSVQVPRHDAIPKDRPNEKAQDAPARSFIQEMKSTFSSEDFGTARQAPKEREQETARETPRPKIQEPIITKEPCDVVKSTPKPSAPMFTLPQISLKPPGSDSSSKNVHVENKSEASTKLKESKRKHEPRMWTSKNGSSKQEATMDSVSSDDKKVLLLKPEGKTIQVPIDSLCSRDIEYINRVEGRIVCKVTEIANQHSKSPVTDQPSNQQVNYSVDGFNWLTFLGNNAPSMSGDYVKKYAGIFSKAGIGEKRLQELNEKKLANMGIRMADMDELMKAIKKMQEIIRKSDDSLSEKTRRLTISQEPSPKSKTTIMIPQFAIDNQGSGHSQKQRTTMTIERRTEEPIVSKVIEPEPIVYEVRREGSARTVNQPQPNMMTMAPRATSPGIVHRNSIEYPNYPPQNGYYPPAQAYPPAQYPPPVQYHQPPVPVQYPPYPQQQPPPPPQPYPSYPPYQAQQPAYPGQPPQYPPYPNQHPPYYR